MRIEAYNQVAQIYQTTSAKNTQATTGTTKSARDQISISSTGRDYQIAKQGVAEATDIREDLVADVKDKMKAGTYEVSTDDFADKLLSQFGSIL